MSKTIIAAMQSMQVAENDDLRFLEVTFSTGATRYTYKTVDTSIEEGDKVVVYTPSGKFEVVTVRKALDIDEVDLYAYRYKFIVQKVDTAVYDEQTNNEDLLLKNLRSRARRSQAAQAAKALLEDSTEDEQANFKKLVRL